MNTTAEICQEQAQQPLSEVSEIGAKATELAGRAHEQLQSVGASLWQPGAKMAQASSILRHVETLLYLNHFESSA